MSIVKYTNKKTGVVTWYESTSHYDPDTKQSRPIRKYLGKEDPVTGKLIPSSGKRGRKSNAASRQEEPEMPGAETAAIRELRSRVRELEEQNRRMQRQLDRKSAEYNALRDAFLQSRSYLEQMESLYGSVSKTLK